MKRNKILIVADSNNEPVKLIKQWLVAFNFSIICIDTQRDIFEILQFDICSKLLCFRINEVEYSSNEFQSFYFHRGAIKHANQSGLIVNREDYADINNAFGYYLTGYGKTVRELTDISFSLQNSIGKNNGGRVNKIEMLIRAKKVGFEIPRTIMTTKKEEVIKFKNALDNIITKSLDLNMTFFDTEKGCLIHNLTSNIHSTDQLPDNFPLSLFQENIEKFVELRVLFFGKHVYSAAILSQNSENTMQDYRNYDSKNPNRVVPFKLPEHIKSKVLELSVDSGLKTGSVDLILTPKGNYYFLELNPQGQFIGISNHCNYYLEKVVAESIIQ